MKKIAIFSEGQTEQLFVAEIIRFFATQRSYFITKVKILGGRKFPTVIMSVDPDEGEIEGAEFYFLLIDCASDGRVVSAMNERYDGLVAEGYETIIGLRDLAPSFSRDQLDKLMAGSRKSLLQDPVDPLLVIAVMEVEAWFIAESSHFEKIHPDLTSVKVLQEIGIDIGLDAALLDTPAETLKAIYGIVGLDYGKSRDEVVRTITALDINEYRDEAALARAGSLKPLFDRLVEIFSEAVAA